VIRECALICFLNLSLIPTILATEPYIVGMWKIPLTPRQIPSDEVPGTLGAFNYGSEGARLLGVGAL